MNGCRHEQEDRKCHHPDVVKEEGYIDWCAEGPGCTRQEPDESDRIEEIKARCEAATRGPWEELCGNGQIYSEGNETLLANGCFFKHADGVFAAHARWDIPFLLGEIDRLQSELAKCTSGNGTYISIESHKYLLEKMRKSVIRQAEKV